MVTAGKRPQPLVVLASQEPQALSLWEESLSAWGCQLHHVDSPGNLAGILATRYVTLVLIDQAFDPFASDQLMRQWEGPAVVWFTLEQNLPQLRFARSGAPQPLDADALHWICDMAVERQTLLDRIRELEGRLAGSLLPGEPGSDGELSTMDQLEKQAIVEALQRSKGNVREAARRLGLGQATVYRKIKRFGIQEDERFPALSPRQRLLDFESAQ